MRKSPSRAQWYAVSALLVLERKHVPRFLAFENVYLVRAKSGAGARRKGARLARAEATAQGALAWNGRPTRVEFGGIRKVVACAANPDLPGDSTVTELHDGAEATYSRFLVRTKADLQKLLTGKPAPVMYEE